MDGGGCSVWLGTNGFQNPSCLQNSHSKNHLQKDPLSFPAVLEFVSLVLTSACGSLFCHHPHFDHLLCLSCDINPCPTDKGILSLWWDHCLPTQPLGPVPGLLIYLHTQVGLILVFSNSLDYPALHGQGKKEVWLIFLLCIYKINHLRQWEKTLHWHKDQSEKVEQNILCIENDTRFPTDLEISCQYFHCHSIRWFCLIIFYFCFHMSLVFPQFSVYCILVCLTKSLNKYTYQRKLASAQV